MASLSSKGIDQENPESDMRLKIAWGVMVGTVAWVMVTFDDIEGIKTLSVLGGLPALFLELLILIALVKVIATGAATSDHQPPEEIGS